MLAIDIDESKTRQIATLCNHVIVADATDEATVAELGLANFDIVFVAIGDSLETSILTTLVLKEAGVNGRTLADLHLLQQSDFQLLAIKRGEVLHNVLTGKMELQLGDILILAGNKHAIDHWLDTL